MAERIRLYMDEHVPRAVTAGLRLRGLEVLTAQEAGLQGAPDEEHLVFALRGGWVIFTQDVDFLRLHAAGRPHRGIVYAPQQTAIGATVRGLMLLSDLFSAGDMVGHVEYL